MKKEKEIDWDNQPLGKQSDKSLSKKLGVSRTTVAYHRNKKIFLLLYQHLQKSESIGVNSLLENFLIEI